jgi:spore maturation protein CgeB
MRVVCINYSTDDPWNPALKSGWYLLALPEYTMIFSTRRANVGDFQLLGCRDVRYLPFAYDPRLFHSPEQPVAPSTCEILFVGGADRERVLFMTQFMRSGLSITLVGDYWDRFRTTKAYGLGHKSPQVINELTATAKVNLCLVRRANRDGHVMRSFEIAAIGGCMLAEDTTEHRELFGGDGECVVYFRTPEEAAERARMLLANDGERRRLALAANSRIVNGAHTYQDRLLAMLRSVPNAPGVCC